MLRVIALVYLTLWASAVKAFYPYFPAYLCTEDNICEKGQTRRAPAPQDASLQEGQAGDGAVTFQLSQRAPVEDTPSSVQAARAADRLRRKYASGKISAGLAEDEADLLKRDNKYTVVTAVDPTDPNSVGVDQDGTDFSYFIKAGLGSSKKSLYMLIDTGAGTTWAMGSDCQSSACSAHNSFSASDSKTYQTVPGKFSIAYGSGTVAGVLAQDTISISSLAVGLTFGVANTTSDDFTHFPFDGILGLSMNKGATDNFMQAVKGAKSLKANIFSIALSRSSDGTNTGEITFGATNPAKFTGDISYTTVASDAAGDWAIPMGDVGYNGKKAGLPSRNGYIDTGTSYVFGPADDVAAVHKLIPGATSGDGKTYTAPCDSNLPITVSFSGVSYSLSPKDWLSPPSGQGVCTSNIYGHEVVKGAWLMGDLFLKNVYTVFDIDQTRIGFANKVAVPISSSTSASSSAPASTSSSNSGASTSSQAATPSTLTSPTPNASTAPSGSASQQPGLSGHETSATAGTAVAETASPTASPTKDSSGEQLESNRYVSIVCIVAVIALL